MTEHDKTPFSSNWISRIKYENEIKDLNPVINLVSIGKYKTGRDRHLWIAKYPNGYVDKRFAMFCDSKNHNNVCYISRNQLTKRKPADALAHKQAYKLEDVLEDVLAYASISDEIEDNI